MQLDSLQHHSIWRGLKCNIVYSGNYGYWRFLSNENRTGFRTTQNEEHRHRTTQLIDLVKSLSRNPLELCRIFWLEHLLLKLCPQNSNFVPEHLQRLRTSSNATSTQTTTTIFKDFLELGTSQKLANSADRPIQTLDFRRPDLLAVERKHTIISNSNQFDRRHCGQRIRSHFYRKTLSRGIGELET